MTARPLRRVIAGLAVRLHISPREIRALDMEEIRELFVVLSNKKRPANPGPTTELPDDMNERQMAVALAAGFGKFV